jgi:predicted nucleic acid-binding protein
MAILSCLVDTNILLRMTRRSDPQHQLVDTALTRLASQGTILHSHTRTLLNFGT